MGRIGWSCVVLAVLGLSGCDCQQKKKGGTGKKPKGALAEAEVRMVSAPPEQLSFHLTEGEGVPVSQARAEQVKGESLSAGQARAILRRMKPLKMEKGDQKTFAMRGRSMPPPRTGETITAPFPPPEAPPPPRAKAPKPLKVLRVSPEGEIASSSTVSVTFSQPMVAVTSHTDALAKGVPVKLSPKVEGQWRWVGTRTLLFERKARFPMATAFTLEVKGGTQSAVGGELPKTQRWRFNTRPPRVIGSSPRGGPHRVDPAFSVTFDQEIDPAAVLRTIKLRGGGEGYTLKLQTEEQLAQAPVQVGAKKARTVAFRASRPLDPDTTYTVTVGPKTPSAEGPLKTKKAETYTFSTYPPLKVTGSNCESRAEGCVPLQGLYIRFNNPLDASAFDKKRITVTPTIEGMQLDLSGASISIWGQVKGRTTYRVSLPSSLPDVFGQTLGAPTVRRFVIGSAPRQLRGDGGSRFRVLDPDGDKALTYYTVNHKELEVRIYAVKPPDLDRFNDYNRPHDPARWMPGKLRLNRRVRVDAAPDELAVTSVDLKPFLKKGHGQLIVLVKEFPFPPESKGGAQWIATWCQVTDLAIDAVRDHGQTYAWVTNLRDGRPVAGARVEIQPAARGGETDNTGLVRLDLVGRDQGRRMVAARGDDLVILGGGWETNKRPAEHVRWYVFDDRKLYRPKEEVRVKGWARIVDMASSGIRQLAPEARTLTWEARGPRNNKIANGAAPITALGGFDFRFKLPDTINLGHGWVKLSIAKAGAKGSSHTHRFRIEEFKRPEFEVVAGPGGGRPYFVGRFGEVQVKAKYYSGGALPDAKVDWNISTRATSFTPPNPRGFTFVGWRPSWWQTRFQRPGRGRLHDLGFRGRLPFRGRVGLTRPSPAVERYGRRSYRPRPSGPEFASGGSQSFSGRTDRRGVHRVRVHLDQVDPPRPVSVSATATVQDVNRRTWTSSANLMVHPASHYVGLKTESYFVKPGQPLKVEAVVVDLDGERVADRPIKIAVKRIGYALEKGQQEPPVQQCKVASATEPVSCTFKTREGGTYLVQASTIDLNGHVTHTDMTRWVGGAQPRRPVRHVQLESVRLIADKPQYEPGDVAKILVLAPFADSEALMTVRYVDLVHKRRFKIKGTSAMLEVPIKEEHLPGLRVHVDLVGAVPRVDDEGEPLAKAPSRPAHATGSIRLAIPPLKRRLQVKLTPAKRRLLPGRPNAITVEVRDAAGKPVPGAEVALVVVDEAVLALTGYSLADPIPLFYPDRYPGVSTVRLRQMVRLADPAAILRRLAQQAKPKPSAPKRAQATAAPEATEGAAPGAAADPAAPPKPKKPPRIRVRKDFRPLALFLPALKTNARGQARGRLTMPDSLTRYRVMAVAVAEARYYGTGESSITAGLPMGIRPSPPRFLNYGDRFELPVVVQNHTSKPLNVRVAIRGTNIEFVQGTGRRLTVPADDRAELRFPARAVEAGIARFQIGVVAGRHHDGVELSLPVWTPATTEAFATYGTIDEGAVVQPIRMPGEVIPVFGGLTITTSSTAVQALTDAVLYLVSYRYGCAEQRASRIIAVAAVRDVLTAFKAPGLPPPEKIKEHVEGDIRVLRTMQLGDGSFPLWRRYTRHKWPYVSLHVTHALVRAKDKGFTVPDGMYNRALSYLTRIESDIPRFYSESARDAIVAYSLYVRALAGRPDVVKAKKLFNKLKAKKNPPMEAIGWIYPVLSGQPQAARELAELRKLLKNRVAETAATAHFVTSYGEGAYLLMHSKRRVDGILLEGLIKDQPESDLIVKVVKGLLAHRVRGRWLNTQENAWVLLALDRYFNTYEKVTPDFVARAWLGRHFAGQHAFRGRTTERHAIQVPMKVLASMAEKENNLTLAKRGPGRLYYRIGMRYAPADLKPPPASHGFTVERRYEAVDDKEDVRRDQDGTWRVKAGARVRVQLTMVATARRYHVALVDQLPAGLEPENAGLRGTQAGARVGGGWWFVHHNLRDERAEAFTALLWPGVHKFTYVTRATTPGTFVVPPPKAEEMYHPETFGRAAGDRLVVE